MPIATEVTDYIRAQIDKLSDELYDLQHEIWAHPELGYKEKNTYKLLTGFMAKQSGWTVTPHAYGLDTAFECVFSLTPEKCESVISFNSEMDALPGIGHACGHNLIAICGVTAAIATAMAMSKFKIPGTVKLIGTPAEEGGGGKVKLLEAGCYDTVDVSLMAHPSNGHNAAYSHTSAVESFEVEFFGKEAHAAASPWQGVNALDAMVLTYNNISVLRQQLMEKDIVQCFIDDGGKAANIISGYTKAMYIVRAPKQTRMLEVKAKVINCIKAAALATGCKYKVTSQSNYYDMVCNDVLAETFSTYMSTVLGKKMLPLELDLQTSMSGASSDQGNVSYAVPALQPTFHVTCPEGGPHTKAFAQAASSKQAHESALTSAMALAFTGLELLEDPEKLKQVKEAFKKDLGEHTDMLGLEEQELKDWVIVN